MMSLSCTISEILVENRQSWPTPLLIGAPVWDDPVEILPRSLTSENQVPGLSYGVVYMILHIAILVQYRCVMDEQTHDDGIYRANIVSCGKNADTRDFPLMF